MMADDSSFAGTTISSGQWGPRAVPQFYPINPTASQVMSPTDLLQCRQLPGDSAKVLDHQESTLRLGLECLLLGRGPRLQLKSGGC